MLFKNGLKELPKYLLMVMRKNQMSALWRYKLWFADHILTFSALVKDDMR